MLGEKQRLNINKNFSTSKKAKSSSRALKSKESLINNQKREKLKQLLVQKYKKVLFQLENVVKVWFFRIGLNQC